MYQALLYLKTNLPVCLFTHSKGIKIGPSYPELGWVSKLSLAMNNSVEHPPTIGDRRRTRVSQRIFQEVQEVQWEVGVKLALCTQLATRRFFCSSAFQVSSVPFWSPLSVDRDSCRSRPQTPYVICIKYRRVLNLFLLSVRCGSFHLAT